MRGRDGLVGLALLLATAACTTEPPVEDPVGFDQPTDAPSAEPSPTPSASPATSTTSDAPMSDETTAPPTPTPSPTTTATTEAIVGGQPAPYGAVVAWEDIEIRLPSARTELVGLHQSNHDGARGLTDVTDPPVPVVVLPTRERGTDRRGAADIVVHPDSELRSPVTGTVKRAGTYTLYCDNLDDFLVIEPDGHPGIEVKLLHIDGVRVGAGDRVVAAETIVAPRPTRLPFASQVDERSGPDDWPHVHLEVVDTSIPDRPNENSGSDDC